MLEMVIGEMGMPAEERLVPNNAGLIVGEGECIGEDGPGDEGIEKDCIDAWAAMAIAAVEAFDTVDADPPAGVASFNLTASISIPSVASGLGNLWLQRAMRDEKSV